MDWVPRSIEGSSQKMIFQDTVCLSKKATGTKCYMTLLTLEFRQGRRILKWFWKINSIGNLSALSLRPVGFRGMWLLRLSLLKAGRVVILALKLIDLELCQESINKSSQASTCQKSNHHKF